MAEQIQPNPEGSGLKPIGGRDKLEEFLAGHVEKHGQALPAEGTSTLETHVAEVKVESQPLPMDWTAANVPAGERAQLRQQEWERKAAAAEAQARAEVEAHQQPAPDNVVGLPARQQHADQERPAA